jgi:hypothetical protein
MLETRDGSSRKSGRAADTARTPFRKSQRCWRTLAWGLALAACSIMARTEPAHALGGDLQTALKTSTYVYIASNRKDDSFGQPAEIWFMYHQGAVWVASPPTTWRVRRIRAGRPKARIAVGTIDGPSFMATGSIVADKSVYEEMYRTFARKYEQGWLKWESRFREGMANGSRVLVKYTPLE